MPTKVSIKIIFNELLILLEVVTKIKPLHVYLTSEMTWNENIQLMALGPQLFYDMCTPKYS